MKQIYLYGWILFLFCSGNFRVVYADQKPVVQVLDSLVIDLSRMDSTICIENSVFLSFDSDSIFACEWIDVATGDTISKEKFLIVSPKTTHQYKVNLYYFTGEKIKNGDFEDEEENKHINTSYTWGEKTKNAWYWSEYGTLAGELWNEGTYRIGKCPHDFHIGFSYIRDHTPAMHGNGNMMCVNGAKRRNVQVYKTRVTGLEIGRTYAFSTWGTAIGRDNPAQFHFTINGEKLGKDFGLTNLTDLNKGIWEQFYELWVADQTEAEIALVNLKTVANGNDFAIDDISFASMEKKTGIITVNVLPQVELGELPDLEKCEGEEICVNAKATGTDITGYTWLKDDIPLNLNSSVLSIPEAALQDAGEYTCVVTGKCGTKENTFRIEVREKLKADQLKDTIWPCEWSKVVLSAHVDGYQPVYKWTAPEKSRGWRDDKAGNYTNRSIQWSRDTGTYICQVSNVCGKLNLYRILKPGKSIQITAWPKDQNVCAGSSLKLEVETEPETGEVVWTGPGVSGQVSGKSLLLQPVREKDAGVYFCKATDLCGASDNRSVILKVTPPLSVLDISRDTSVCENGTAVFEVFSDAVRPVYHWTGPGNFIAKTSRIIIQPVTADRTGIYRVTVTDSCGNTLNGQVELSLLNEYEDIKITAGQKVCPGGEAVLEVTGGEEDMSYTWTFPSGKQYTGAALHLSPAEAGMYTCRIAGICPAVEKTTLLECHENIAVDAGENRFRVCEGETVCFMPEIRRGENGVGEWWKDGLKISEGKEYCLPGVKAGDAGKYEYRVHSLCGDTILHYEVQIKENTRITGYLPDRYVRPGEKVMLFVNAKGEDLRYEWVKEGLLIEGTMGNRIGITASDKEGVTAYTCRVSGCQTEIAVIRVHVSDYINLAADTVVALCAGQNYAYRAEDQWTEECQEGIRQHWVFQGKDTVAYGSALDFQNFQENRVGEYVYTQESKCGKKQIRLTVISAGRPLITGLYCAQAVSSENGIFSVCNGEDIEFVAEAEANGLLSYEWSKDGKIIAGQNAPSLKLNAVSAKNEGNYTCRVISAVCGEDEKTIRLKVNKKLTVTPPEDLVLCPGEEARLSIYADASTPSEFIWEGPTRNGWTARSDGYGATYENKIVDKSSDGVYTCRINNSCGKEMVQARILVEQEMSIPEIAREDTLCPGAAALLHVQVEQEDARYSWILPGHEVVEGEYLSIPVFSVADTGTYHYHIETKNGCFSREEDVHLVIRKALEILYLTPDTAVCKGRDVYLEAYAEGKNVKYEWWGPHGFMEEGQKIYIDHVMEQNTGMYEVVVTDECNITGKRGRIRLSLLKEFDDLIVSRDTGVCVGSEVAMSVSGETEGLSYEWLFNGHTVSRQSRMVISAAKPEDAGSYVCRISGRCQEIEENVDLQVYPLLQAVKTDPPAVCERENTVLTLNASGEQLKYKWTKEGGEKGYRTDRLELNDVIPADEGIYQCHVSSVCGDTTLQYEFRLKEKTRIFRHSTDRILCEDDTYDLFVEATGENNLYRWTCDGEELTDRGNIIHRPATGCADTLLYTCVVEGDCGVDSVYMRIVVGEFRKVWEDREDMLCEGSNYKYNADIIPPGTFDGMSFNYEWIFNGRVVSHISLLSFEEIKPEEAGDYYCRVSTRPGAPVESDDTVRLTVHVTRLPRMENMSDDLYVVEGSRDSIRVDVSGDGLAYSWMKDGEQAENGTKVWYFEPIVYEDRGNYRVTASNQCGHVSGETNVEVWRKTVIVFPQERDDSVCMHGDIGLEVEAWGEDGLLYKWYLDGEDVDAPCVQPLHLEQVEREQAGTYLCVVSGRGGTDSCKIHLKVLDLPDAGIDGRFRLCRDDSELMQRYTGQSNEERVDYFWLCEGGEINEGNSWEMTTIYWDREKEGKLSLKVTSLSTGCSREKSRDIEWNSIPEVSLSVPYEVGYCLDSMRLDKAYPWGGDFYVNGLLQNVAEFTNKMMPYAIAYQYTDAETGCTGRDEDTIHIARPPVLLLAEDTIISGWCVPVILNVKEHTDGEISWQGSDPLDIRNPEQAVFRPAAYTDQHYHFYSALTDVYGCRVMDSVDVLLLPSPQVRLMEDTVIGICNDLVLHAVYDAASVRELQWSPEGSLEVITPFRAAVTDKSAGENSFSLSVTDAYGCIGRDTVQVRVYAAPEPAGKEICAGDSLEIDVREYREYAWADGYTGEQRVIRDAGTYRLEVKDQYGCWGKAEYSVHALPVVDLPDTLIFEGQQWEYKVEVTGDFEPYDIFWQDGSAGETYRAEKEGYYSVTVEDNIGCSAADTAFLEVRKEYIAAPDAFLPESGGENSKFYLKELNFVERFEMYIYDRWGELIFKTHEIGFNGGWDGTFKGIKCQPGAYVWVVYVNGKEAGRGTVMLVK